MKVGSLYYGVGGCRSQLDQIKKTFDVKSSTWEEDGGPRVDCEAKVCERVAVIGFGCIEKAICPLSSSRMKPAVFSAVIMA